jgi:translation initiation factor 2 subunit 1
MAMRVDKDKGYIDLSKRRVSREEAIACEDRYNKGKTVYTIMRHVAETTHSKLIDLMQMIAWPLNRKFRSAFDAFQLAVSDHDTVFADLNVPPEIMKPLLANIRRRMTPQPVRIRADIDVTCFNEAGIDAVRDSLLMGETAGTEDIPVKIKLIAPPMYVLLATSLDKKLGLEVVTNAITAIEKKINEFGGKLIVRQAPHATSQEDEHELAAQIERLENQNREVDGDENDDDGPE